MSDQPSFGKVPGLEDIKFPIPTFPSLATPGVNDLKTNSLSDARDSLMQKLSPERLKQDLIRAGRAAAFDILAQGFKRELRDMYHRKDPQFLFDWAVAMPFNANISNYVESVDMPFDRIDADNVYRQAREIFYPGFSSVSNFTMTFYEDNEFTVTGYLLDWQSRVKNEEGDYAVPSAYKAPIFVTPRASDTSKAMVFVLNDCFPLHISNFQWASDTGDRLIVSCEFSTDNIIPVAIKVDAEERTSNSPLGRLGQGVGVSIPGL